MTIDRRRLLEVAAGMLGAAALAPAVRAAAVGGECAATGPLAALRDPAAAARLGRRYLRTLPKSVDGTTILRQVEESLAHVGGGGMEAGDRAALREALRRAIEGEFAAGDIVEVDGWLLAPTEARLCALAALNPVSPQGT